MNLPKFTADAALGKPTRNYRGTPQFGSFSHSGASADVQPNQLDDMEGSEGLDDAGDTGMLADEAEGGEDSGDEGSEGFEDGEESDSGEDSGEGDEGGEEMADEG